MEETGASESKRSRKQTAFFEVAAKTATKAVVAEEGAGIKLADNPHFCKELEKVKGDNEVCKALHLLLFNSAGKKLEIKRNLRAFSGFPSEAVRDEKKLKVNEKKKLWTNANIKAALGLFGLEKGGDRDVLVNRMIEYLAKPVFTKQAKDGSKKRKSSSKTSKKGGKKAKKVKRTVAPSAYILFCKDSRPALREAQPELSMIEQTKALGAMWNVLSAEEKEPFVERARQAKLTMAASGSADAGADIDFGSDDDEEDADGDEQEDGEGSGDEEEDGEEDGSEGGDGDDGAEDDFKDLEDSDDDA